MIEQIRSSIEAELEFVELDVQGEGGRYEIYIVSELFAGMNRVKKQQTVYRPIKPLLADGSVHAITIKAFAPSEVQD